MPFEVDRIKKLALEDMIVDAVELPPNHKRKPLITDDIEEVLERFDDDADYAHFIIRVKRTRQHLNLNSISESTVPLSINTMVNETLELSQKKSLDNHFEHDPDFLLKNALILENSQEYVLARNILFSLVHHGLCVPQALANIARIYEKENKYPKAERYYKEAIAYASELSFYQSLAALQIRSGKDKEAIETLILALGLASLKKEEEFDFHKSLGNCFTRLSNFSKAEYHYVKAYEINSKSDVLQVNVGSLALQKQDQETAQKHFEKAIELNSKNENAICGLGMVFLAQNKLQKAHDYFAQSLTLNPNNLPAIYNLVKCAYELKSFNSAAEFLKLYLATNSNNTNILYSYAGILFYQEKPQEALGQVQKILKINPTHEGARDLEQKIKNMVLNK